MVMARRRQEESFAQASEVAVARDRFQLVREQIVFVVELVVALVILGCATVVLIAHPELIPAILAGGGGVSSAAALLHRSKS